MPFISFHVPSPSFFCRVPLLTSTRNLHPLVYDWSPVSKADIGFQRKISEAIILCPHFQCRGGPRGCFKHVDSDCYDHRSPAFVSSTLLHSSLEVMAFPFVFCRPYTVSTDLRKTDRQTEGEVILSHISQQSNLTAALNQYLLTPSSVLKQLPLL